MFGQLGSLPRSSIRASITLLTIVGGLLKLLISLIYCTVILLSSFYASSSSRCRCLIDSVSSSSMNSVACAIVAALLAFLSPLDPALALIAILSPVVVRLIFFI